MKFIRKCTNGNQFLKTTSSKQQFEGKCKQSTLFNVASFHMNYYVFTSIRKKYI